jgi:hypothetical protein
MLAVPINRRQAKQVLLPSAGAATRRLESNAIRLKDVLFINDDDEEDNFGGTAASDGQMSTSVKSLLLDNGAYSEKGATGNK